MLLNPSRVKEKLSKKEREQRQEKQEQEDSKGMVYFEEREERGLCL